MGTACVAIAKTIKVAGSIIGVVCIASIISPDKIGKPVAKVVGKGASKIIRNLEQFTEDVVRETKNNMEMY